MGLIAANDPALAILGKLGQNQLASQLLLSDPEHGATNADRLVQYDWDYTGTSTDESSTPGRVIIQATSDRGPDESGERSARPQRGNAVRRRRDALERRPQRPPARAVADAASRTCRTR